jgi:hypothetical protein
MERRRLASPPALQELLGQLLHPVVTCAAGGHRRSLLLGIDDNAAISRFNARMERRTS